VTSDTAYKIIQYAANQFQRGNVSPARFSLIINYGSTSFLDYYLGQMQQYQYGSPASRVQFGVNETARQRLSPLIDPVTEYTPDITGFVPYPPLFEQVDAMYDTSPNFNRIRFVPQHKLPNYKSDPIDPVATNPIYILESEGFRIYPNMTEDGIASPTIRLSFVHTPPIIVWNSSLDANGRPQYQDAGSVGLWCYEVDSAELIARGLRLVGVNLQANQVSQYAETIIKEGQ